MLHTLKTAFCAIIIIGFLPLFYICAVWTKEEQLEWSLKLKAIITLKPSADFKYADDKSTTDKIYVKVASPVLYFTSLVSLKDMVLALWNVKGSQETEHTNNYGVYLTLTWILFWVATRLNYALNSWIYTTNHKRIAINYFNFVLVSGTAGMSLASVIRLEFAYPGIGVLVGDSLQYLSIATAHGVIMVFFMIMPAIFGGFGNFLLPTQLGVHDVAFPRLNSAAFWFLPGGLIMLCQLICIDRRYQRLNCFNMRQLETILRRQFFVDFLSTGDHRQLMTNTMVGLRFKVGQEQSAQPDQFSFYKFGLTNHENLKVTFFEPRGVSSNNSSSSSKSFFFFCIDSYLFSNDLLASYQIDKSLWTLVTRFIENLINFNTKYFNTSNVFLGQTNNYGQQTSSPLLVNLMALPTPSLLNLFNVNKLAMSSSSYQYPTASGSFYANKAAHTAVGLVSVDTASNPQNSNLNNFSDSSHSGRFNRFSNPMVEYEYRKGTYFTVWSDRFPNLTTSMIELGRNEYFAKWFKSAPYKNLFREDINYLDNFKPKSLMTGNVSLSDTWYSSHVRPTTNLLNIMGSLQLGDVYLQPTLWAVYPKKWRLSRTDVFTKEGLDLLSPALINDFIQIGPKTLHFPFFYRSNKKEISLSQGLVLSQLHQTEQSNFFRSWISVTVALKKISVPQGLSNSLDPKILKSYLTNKNWFILNKLLLNGPSWFYQTSSNPLTNAFVSFVSPNGTTNNSSTGLLFPKTRLLVRLIGYGSVESTPLKKQSELTSFQLRWSANPVLTQKYYRLFSSDSTQQRVVANWRELKFTREAWRCKLLVARHQTALFRRFTNEDSLFWAIERNAKDLLPGWAMITPFSARTRYTAVGKTDIGLMAVFIVLNSSIISSANFLITYRYLSTLNNRKMRDARSFFTEGLITASWMMVAANPMLMIGIIMLLSDRHWQTSFFDYSGGGDAILFQHMFWFFGHPEVYVIMLPVFGYVNTILSYYLRKRISARGSLMYSMYTIAFLGFFVWGHHMYMVGLSHTTRMLFSTLTVMISVPAATKLMHWSVTVVNSFFTLELPLLFTLTFIFFFVSGGVSGMYVANTGMDVLFHDTFYVIGHFHVMFAGSAMIGIFAAFYFYFPALYGVKYSRIYGYVHYTYYIIGQLMTVIPMLWLGYCGQPRRVLDYPSAFGSWHSISSAGHLLSVGAMLAFFIMIYDSVRQSKPAVRNTFGVGRFNTRLNFFFFEIYRLKFTQQKNFLHSRAPRNTVNQSSRARVVTSSIHSKSTRKNLRWLYDTRPINVNLLLLKSFETSTAHYVWVKSSNHLQTQPKLPLTSWGDYVKSTTFASSILNRRNITLRYSAKLRSYKS